MCDMFTDGDWIEAQDQSDSGIRLIQTGNIGVTEYLDKPNHKKWISKDTFEALHCEEVFPGDILISRLPEPAGRACIVPELGAKMITAVDCTIVRPSNNISRDFLVQYLSSQQYFNEVNTCLAGGTRQRISRSNLANFDIPNPINKDEQQKIGMLLSRLDTFINLTQQKLDQLKTLKKACLEKIFPKEGETVPEIRFKGFEGPWEWKKLGGIADIVGGGTPSTSIPEYWSGNISWYSPAEIGNKVFVSESQRKITKAGYNHCSANILPPGTVLFTSRAGIGKTAILEKEGCTNQGFQSIIPHKEQLDSYFIYSRTAELKQYGETVGAGSTFVEVSGKQMADMDILIPAILEQQVIGGYFRNLDNLISIIQQKLDQLKNLKKALLDRMFV